MHKHVYGLDLMRAVAIALVVFQHGALFFYICYGAPEIWTKIGAIGVTLFFALSGYLIGGILLDLGATLRDARVASRFWLRRALRTLPNYFVFLAVNVARTLGGRLEARNRPAGGAEVKITLPLAALVPQMW